MIKSYNTAVIGGGPAGIMAAIVAAGFGQKVVLVEKNKQLGKKLLLTGKGRCNLTNAEFSLKNLVQNYHNGEFLFHALSLFGPKETIEFFNGLEIKTKLENNKVFPVSESAEQVLDALNKALAKNKVEIILGSAVLEISAKNKKIQKIVLADKTEIKAEKYIFCVGGKSYPLTGSDGSSYALLEKLGHKIASLTPALCPLRVSSFKKLQGISLENVETSIIYNNKKTASELGPILFTHYGISGPAILNISGKAGEFLQKGKIKINIDLFPKLNQEEVLAGLEELLNKYPRQEIKNVLSELAPARFMEVFLDNVKISPQKPAANMSKIEKRLIAKTLKNFEAVVEDVFGFDLAMATRGGVALKEIDHKTMKSKIISNLYFAGEIIDVDGKTGGFNLQMCWATGRLAGTNT